MEGAPAHIVEGAQNQLLQNETELKMLTDAYELIIKSTN